MFLVLILLTYKQLCISGDTLFIWVSEFHLCLVFPVILLTTYFTGHPSHFCWLFLTSQLLHVGIPKMHSLGCFSFLSTLFAEWSLPYNLYMGDSQIYISTPELLPELYRVIYLGAHLDILYTSQTWQVQNWSAFLPPQSLISIVFFISVNGSLLFQLLRPKILKASLIVPSLTQVTCHLSAHFNVSPGLSFLRISNHCYPLSRLSSLAWTVILAPQMTSLLHFTNQPDFLFTQNKSQNLCSFHGALNDLASYYFSNSLPCSSLLCQTCWPPCCSGITQPYFPPGCALPGPSAWNVDLL